MTENTAVLNGITNPSVETANATMSVNVTKHMKLKQNSHSSHSSSKASAISYQKASVHYVRVIICLRVLFKRVKEMLQVFSS